MAGPLAHFVHRVNVMTLANGPFDGVTRLDDVQHINRGVEDTLEIPIQVNGKLRDKIVVPAAATQQEIESAAVQCEKVKPFLEGKTVKKVIVVPKKLVNIVVA